MSACITEGGVVDRSLWRCILQERFGSRINVISKPPDCDTSTLRGAAQYGLARRPLVSSVVAPQSYMLQVSELQRIPFGQIVTINHKVKLPAEQEDELKRPAYITTNNANVRICENR